MSSKTVVGHGVASCLRKPAAWVLALTLAVSGCSGQPTSQSTVSLSPEASASPNLAAPTTCGDFLALTSDERDQVFPDSTSHAQYTDQGVNVAKAKEIYAEICQTKDPTVPLAGLVADWEKKAPPSCERFLAETTAVREKWVLWVPLVGLDARTKAHVTAADWVQVCTANGSRLLPDLVSALDAIVKARDAQADASASAEAAASAALVAASKKSGSMTVTTSEGYFLQIDYSFSSPIATIAPTINSKPQEATIQIRQGIYTLKLTNVTPGRNLPGYQISFPNINLVSDKEDPMCLASTRYYWEYPGPRWDSIGRCVGSLGLAASEVQKWPSMLSPGESVSLTGGGTSSEVVKEFSISEDLANKQLQHMAALRPLELFFINWSHAIKATSETCTVVDGSNGGVEDIVAPPGSTVCKMLGGKPVKS